MRVDDCLEEPLLASHVHVYRCTPSLLLEEVDEALHQNSSSYVDSPQLIDFLLTMMVLYVEYDLPNHYLCLESWLKLAYHLRWAHSIELFFN